jgi:hypothetical protein
MTTAPTFEVKADSRVHRYAMPHWQILRPFIEGTEQDPKGSFFLTEDVWDLWTYAQQGTPSYRSRYRLRFDGLHSFLKPFVKWHCYQRLLQQPGDLRTGLRNIPYQLRRSDDYLIEHEYSSLDDLAPPTIFEDLWTALLPPKEPPFTYHDVRLQAATRSFWLHLSVVFGLPLWVPPIAPHVYARPAETGLDESSLIPQPIIAQLANKLALHRDGTCQLNRFHHLRLCVLLLSICLGRRITEVLLAPRGDGLDGPLTVYPARGKEKDGGLWFRMQLIYQHHLRLENAKLREKIAQHQLHGLGTYWLEQCLGLVKPGTHLAFREGSPTLADPRWRALIVNNPQFVQANRVSCGLCALPQGPAGCQEFMHCTEVADEGCTWFLTDPNDVQMQAELQERARAHRAKQRESEAARKMIQARKYGVMAERTERLSNKALQKASEEVRLALLGELNTFEEES